jgi:leader peptidase (prepilin peptidase)/N-methyltransferase
VSLELLLWALFGVIGGGVAYRLADRLLEDVPGSGMTLLPRCPRCGHAQTPLQRVALLALPLRLHCASCGLGASREQAIVEVVTAALVLGLRLRSPDPVLASVYCLATLVLVAVSITDLRERLIPNAVSYPATVAGLAASLLPGAIGPFAASVGGLIGGGVALAIWLLGRVLYRRGDVFGLGDVKLALFIGVMSGVSRGLTALVWGVILGGLLAAVLIVVGRGRRTTMAYGPALAAGAYLTWLLG